MTPEIMASVVAALQAKLDAFVDQYEKVCKLQAQLAEERDRRYTESQQQRDEALVLALVNTHHDAVRDAAAMAVTAKDLAELKTWMYTTIGQVKGRTYLIASVATALGIVSTLVVLIANLGGG